MMMIDILSGSVPFCKNLLFYSSIGAIQFVVILRNILFPWKIGHCHLMN